MPNRWALPALALLLSSCSSTPPTQQRAEAPPKPDHAPDVYRVKFETTKGDFTVEVTRAWAPHGADRFFELVNEKYFDEARFYRVLRKFIAQFGIHRNPKMTALWAQLKIPDDPPKEKNRRGTLAFAKDGPATRTSQIFINLADNKILDNTAFVPFGRVVEGMEVCDQIAFLYGELGPKGNGPDPKKLEALGNEYLARDFPRMDWIKQARIIP